MSLIFRYRAGSATEGRPQPAAIFGWIDAPVQRWQFAAADLVGIVEHWRIWGALGWSDILQRYRRSVLGPLWITVSMGVMVGSLGLLYGTLFKIPISDFLPFVCVGILVWGFINSLLTEAGTVFTSNELFIKQLRLPFSIYVCRFVWSKTIVFFHNFLIYVIVAISFGIWPDLASLFAIPGFVIFLLNAFFVTLILGLVSARFRDVPQIVAATVQVIFFVTPVLWKPELLQSHHLLVELNPFYHFIEILRSPLLGSVPPLDSVAVVLFATGVNACVAWLLFIHFRARIAYWM